jgi:hypothetical protein
MDSNYFGEDILKKLKKESQRDIFTPTFKSA